MVRRMGLGWMVVWVACAAAARADEPATTGVIVGRLVDVEGKGVADASVWGISLRKEVARAKSDGDGRFRLGPLSEDKPVDVWFEGPELARERREDVHVFGGRDHDLGNLTLVPGTRLKGRVVDARGQAIAGAKISIDVYRRELGHTINSNQAKWELSSDPEGRFRSLALPAGEGNLNIAAPGKVRAYPFRRTMPGTPEMDLDDIKLEDEIPIRGVVVDQAGQPAPKVEVMADYDYDNMVLTDEKGRFTLGGTGREAKELRLTSNDYFAPKPFPIGADRENVRLEVIKAYEILGSAVDAETGKPVLIDTVRLCMVIHEPDGTTSLQG